MNMTSPQSAIGFKYEGVYAAIRHQLEREPLPDSGPLFTEQSLVDRYGASRTTVRKALNRLEEEGYIIRKPRLGTFPGETLLTRPAAPTLQGLTDRAVELAQTIALKESAAGWIDPPHQVQEALEIGSDQHVLRFTRVRDAGEGVLVGMTTWFREDVGAVLELAELADKTPVDLVTAKGFVVSKSRQRIAAGKATKADATRLNVKTGSVLFVIKSTVVGGDTRPLLYSEHLSPADRFEFQRTFDADGTADLLDIVRLPPADR